MLARAATALCLSVLLAGPGAADELSNEALLGGATTIVADDAEAFLDLAPNASDKRRRDFALGSRLFAIEWAPYPNEVGIFDGLGPTFNRESCAGCHPAHGRGADGALLRLSLAGEDAAVPHPAYGDQLNDRAIAGVAAEGQVRVAEEEIGGFYGDGTPYTLWKPRISLTDLAHGPLDDAMTSLRVAPAVIGLGLLEAVPEATLAGLADPEDEDGDGISGRLNRLDAGGTVGRFGWKANVADLRHQTAMAAFNDMGLTTTLFPAQNCPAAQADCIAAPGEPGLEISEAFLDRMVTAMRLVAVPAQRNTDDPLVMAGSEAFDRMGCAACHVPTLATDGTAVLEELRKQTFHPYTDLLLHDMGEGLADNRPDHNASGTEWRTPPLWGLGLVPVVNGHDRLLHDGRARGFAEAILWHGGEAEAAREAFRTAPREERDALVAFLGSL